MYRLTLAVASAAAVILLSYANAGAADYYPARQRAQMDRLVQSVQPPSYNWTGLYAGLNGGYSAGQDLRGFTGGGQVGYNYQPAYSNWVVGIEADLQYNQQPAWWGTVRGRAGYLLDPTLLVYGTGGLAYQLNSTPFNTHHNTVGWTAGGGVEKMLGRNWSVKAEYLYVAPGHKQDANIIRAGINYKF